MKVLSKVEGIKNIILKTNEDLILPVAWFGKEKEISYDIYLAGINSGLTLLMLLFGKKEDSVKIQINIFHQNKSTNSKVIMKGVIGDSANVDFEGKVKIEQGSKNSSAWLSANLLLLSGKAKGRAVPALEILENDIKAGHATTIGKINNTELFYLMSRGLPEIKAQNIIVQGFLSGFLQSFPEGIIKKEIRKKLAYET